MKGHLSHAKTCHIAALKGMSCKLLTANAKYISIGVIMKEVRNHVVSDLFSVVMFCLGSC